MTDTPEDIRAKAEEIAGNWFRHPIGHAATMDIAQALMEERERCAKIADDSRISSCSLSSVPAGLPETMFAPCGAVISPPQFALHRA